MVFAVFNPDLDPLRARVIHRLGQALQNPLEIDLRNALPLFHGREFAVDVFPAQRLSLRHQIAKPGRDVERADPSAVDDHKRRPELFRPVNRPAGEADSTLAVAGAVGGELVAVRVVG